MASKFKPQEYVHQVLQNLIHEYKNASTSGTPGLIGHNREDSARKQLQRLLPGVAKVSSGLIFDSYDGISRQQDLVIYEKDQCPVFTINNLPEATYYPCEGVISVGEIKSSFGSKELEDAFLKIASVKELKRHLEGLEGELLPTPSVCFRLYGSSTSFHGTKEEELDPRRKEIDQVFGFILCEKFTLKPETMIVKIAELSKKYPDYQMVNIVISLQNGFFQFGDISQGKSGFSAMGAHDIIYSKDSELGFSLLIRRLNHMIRHGRTTELGAYKCYFEDRENKTFQATLTCSIEDQGLSHF